jgi:hypothetical protein
MVEGGNRSEDNNEIGSIHSCTVFSAFLENFEKTFFSGYSSGRSSRANPGHRHPHGRSQDCHPPQVSRVLVSYEENRFCKA